MPRGGYKLYGSKPYLDPEGFTIDPRRSWRDDPLLDIQPWHPQMFWKYLVYLAVWDEKGVRVRRGGEVVAVERGQLFYSSRFLGQRPGWSKDKVRLELGKLEEEGRIRVEPCHGGTLITIVNYDPYQDIEWYLEDAQGKGSLQKARRETRRETRHGQRLNPSGDSSRQDGETRRETRHEVRRRQDTDETNNKTREDREPSRAREGRHDPTPLSWNSIRASRTYGVWARTPPDPRRDMLARLLRDELPPPDLARFVRDQCVQLDIPLPAELTLDDSVNSGEAPVDEGPAAVPDDAQIQELQDELRHKLARITGGQP